MEQNAPLTVFAIGAHPDDIEFLMGGTLLRLREAGCCLHYMTVANGCCGSIRLDPEETAQLRRDESQAAAKLLGATYHESLCRDLEIFYHEATLKSMSSIMRKVAPDIVLTHALSDYMEDHMNTARLVVTAAFAIGMPNFPVTPPCSPIDQPIAVYHAQPFMNQDPLGEPVWPRVVVDVTALQVSKRDLLACHASQREWLDVSQGLDSYLETSIKLDKQVGSWSSRFDLAEGWTQHASTGLASPDWDPLTSILPSQSWERIRVAPRGAR